MSYIIIPLIGFSNGIVVGSGIVALITLLDIVPRLGQLTKTYKFTVAYQNAIIGGATIAAFLSLINKGINTGAIFVILIGFAMGTFVGLLASALAEVMNVIPVLIRRFKIEEYVFYIVYSLILGKTIGSFIHWLILH
ncbi:stage V sporulation protein AB [Clostridium aceticum]|uniref:Stage V sporulation protein AB n=1 Tax=Clostridium aceticum TaxID=84022 RepID=A0A0D8IFB4_9CLOT|nr:stage V sporulation protein AB [Clostridium aceticum]AKL94962.1 stage V sporulation protein AB [Clostridium aceticum]KJF27876.1 stage V sporulation protein AC [Clostridium aceticum]